MCCALNSDDAIRNTTYGSLVEEMQNHLLKSEKKVATSVGKKEGLTLVLDLHSNHASFGTVTDNYNAFNLFIGGPTEFPVLRERSLQLEPGKEHSLQFSGQVDHLVLALLIPPRFSLLRESKTLIRTTEGVSSQTRGTSITMQTIPSPTAGAQLFHSIGNMSR